MHKEAEAYSFFKRYCNCSNPINVVFNPFNIHTTNDLGHLLNYKDTSNSPDLMQVICQNDVEQATYGKKVILLDCSGTT